MTDHIIASNFSSLTNSAGHVTELDPFDLTACVGDFASEFDMDAINDDYYGACCEALAAIRPEWSLLRDAEVIGPVDSPDLDEDERAALSEHLDTIDVTAILQRHTI